MRSQYDGLSRANEVSEIAEGLPAALENAGESSALVRVAESDDSDDAVLNSRRKLARSQVGHLGTLTIEGRMNQR
jgi:hypothetical protein